jgi:hypothetical protein
MRNRLFELEQIKTGCMCVNSSASFIWLIHVTHYGFSLQTAVLHERSSVLHHRKIHYRHICPLPDCCFLRPNVLNSIVECGEPTSTPPSKNPCSLLNIDKEASTSSGPRKKLNKELHVHVTVHRNKFLCNKTK